jgi:hypothetical protein
MVEEEDGYGEPPIPEDAVVTIEGLNQLFSGLKELGNPTYAQLVDDSGYLIPKKGEAVSAPIILSYFSIAGLYEYIYTHKGLIHAGMKRASILIDVTGKLLK